MTTETSAAGSPPTGPLHSALEDILANYRDSSGKVVEGPQIKAAFMAVKTALSAMKAITARPYVKVDADTWRREAHIPWITIYREGTGAVPAPHRQCAYIFDRNLSGVYLAMGARQFSGTTTALRQTTLNMAESLVGSQPIAEGQTPVRFYPAQAVPGDDVLEQDLEEILQSYDRVTDPEVSTPPLPPPPGSDLFAELRRRTFLPEDQLRDIEALLRRKRQIVVEGPPGSGKTFVADLFARYFTGGPMEGQSTKVVTVQLHQSYGYEDFVQGIRPTTNEEGQITYEVQDGIFKRFCERARQFESTPHVMVVDEINRGNLSRVFGELLLLLEYRDREVQLPYAEGDLPFSIPPQVYLIGTMNTADRSLAQIDYALRRRFFFYRLMPLEGDKAPVLGGWLAEQEMSADRRYHIHRLFVALNKKILERLGEHFLVGHSYFMNDDVKSDEGVRRIWSWAIMPLLEEYFYGQRDRVELLKEFSMDKLLGEVAVERDGPQPSA